MPPTEPNPSETSCASRSLPFVDPRSPHQIRCLLERRLMVPFEPRVREGGLEFEATSKCNGLPCRFRLVYVSAREESNFYALHLQMSWSHMPTQYHDYYGKTAQSWFDLWSEGFEGVGTEEPPFLRGAEYDARVEEALSAAERLTRVADIQGEILAALRGGATFATAHKEGGTRIRFEGGRYLRIDYGESEARESFAADAEFLAFLRRFFDSETSRGDAPEKFPEEIVWRLILRLLNP
jgi:hypothetical protein